MNVRKGISGNKKKLSPEQQRELILRDLEDRETKPTIQEMEALGLTDLEIEDVNFMQFHRTQAREAREAGQTPRGIAQAILPSGRTRDIALDYMKD